MRVMDEFSESTHRRTPVFPHAGGQSPRVGGCVGKFYQLFDWSLTKRFSSTKRITADKPNQDAFSARRDRSFTERASITSSKLSLVQVDKEKEDAVCTLNGTATILYSIPSPASVKSDDSSKRVPGVVARLMGLESLPGRTYMSSPKSGTSELFHSTILTEPPPLKQLGPPPVLLQELLRQEFQQSRKSLKDKFPAFTKLGAVTQKKHLRTDSEEHVQRHGNSGASRSAVHSEKKEVSFTPEEDKAIEKLQQPFLARIQTSAPLPSNSQSTSTSPLLSPTMLRGKDTVRLLEAAVKAREPSMQPSPRGKYSLTIRETHRETKCESSRSDKRALTGSRGSSSSRSCRSPSASRTSSGKDERTVRSGHEPNSPGSRSPRGRQGQASRTRFENSKTLVTSSRSVSPLQSHRSRSSQKRVEDSPRTLLGTHEASIRGFKTDLSNRTESPSEKKLEKLTPGFPSEVEVHPDELLPVPSPNHERTNVKVDSPESLNLDQNGDVLEADTSQTSTSMSETAPEKPSSGGFRSIRFRSRSGKQEKDVGGQGNRVFPSDKHTVEKPGEFPPTKEAKVASAGFSYSMLFSRKQGDKEGHDKAEADVVLKRTDSSLMRSLLKRTSKFSKRVNVEVERVEPAEAGVGNQDSSLSPTRKQLENTKEGLSFVQARCRTIDDVFPELPMEEKDASEASPDLKKTIKAVEGIKFLGFGSQGDADIRSIERMFGKSFSRTYTDLETSPRTPEEFVTECRVPGTFPNSPSAKYEESCFTSRNHLNLEEMFEAVSGDRSHDLTGRRRSFCLSEPRERVLNDEETGAESDTCSNSVVIAGRLEIQRVTVASDWSEDAMTPPALKKFEEKLAQGFSDSDDSHVPCADESCGQPSPVSVLQSPFLEEAPTTPDASLAELQQVDEHLNDIEHMDSSTLEDDEDSQTQETKDTATATQNILEVALPETIETDMIEQAILDISRIRNIDVRAMGLEAPAIAPAEPQEEQDYIRKALAAANLLRERDPGCCVADSPMDPSLFERVGSGSGILRSERKLLFDSVTEVMALERTSSFYVDLHSSSKLRLPMSSGEALVTEVYRMICHWGDIAGNVLDDLIDYDMSVPEGRWVSFSHEAADVALQIERALLKGMIKEVVDDLTSISATRTASRAS